MINVISSLVGIEGTEDPNRPAIEPLLPLTLNSSPCAFLLAVLIILWFTVGRQASLEPSKS